jgi:CRP-like cAMP-binding protein
LAPDDLRALGLLTGPLRHLRKGEYLRHEGSADPDIYRLSAGWLVCSVGTSDGGRQITAIHLPGELVGMPSFAATAAAETIQASTHARVELIPIGAFSQLFQQHPRLAGALFLGAQQEQVHLMHQLTLVGRMQAQRRVAALILSIYRRLTNGDATPIAFEVPLTQQDIADATGMSIVHANRSLKALRTQRIATWQDGRVTIHDLAGLERLVRMPAPASRNIHWL